MHSVEILHNFFCVTHYLLTERTLNILMVLKFTAKQQLNLNRIHPCDKGMELYKE